MKIQALYDVQQEIDRLFIAGSKFAKGDPRLLRLVPVFEKMGEKAPVFKKIAADVRELTECDSREASSKLMALSGLLYSVLYTQGEALEEGEGIQQEEQRPLFALEDVDTSRTYAQLRMVRDISQAKDGRLELLKEAHANGLFNDFRTHAHLEALVEDRYAELAEYAVEAVIPSVGQAMIPFLLNRFEYKDTVPHLRRLNALINLDAPQLAEIVPRLFEENVPKLQVAACRYLENDPINEEFLLTLTEDKKKDVREAAFSALMHIGSVKAVETLRDMVYGKKKARSLPVETLISQYAGDACYEEFLFSARFGVATTYRQGLERHPDNLVHLSQGANAGIQMLKHKNRPETLAFFEEILRDEALWRSVEKAVGALAASRPDTQKGYLERLYTTIVDAMVDVLDTLDCAQTLTFYERCFPIVRGRAAPVLWCAYFKTALGQYGKEQIYDVFAPAVLSGKLALSSMHLLIQRLEADLFGSHTGYTTPYRGDWLDQRWKDILYDRLYDKKLTLEEARVAMVLLHWHEPSDNKKFNDFIVKARKLFPLETYHADWWFHILVERQVPACYDILCDYCSKNYKERGYFLVHYGKDLLKDMPLKYWEKLKTVVSMAPDRYFAELVDEMIQLKQ